MAAAKACRIPRVPVQLAVTVQHSHLRKLLGDRLTGAVTTRVVEYEYVQRHVGDLLGTPRAQTGEGRFRRLYAAITAATRVPPTGVVLMSDLI
jgi:hypothetical protein